MQHFPKKTQLTDRVEDVANRTVAVHMHGYRKEAVDAACSFIERLNQNGIVAALREDHRGIVLAKLPNADTILRDDAESCELVLVFGGDGTILRAAEWAIGKDIPLMGVNLGHVGFLAELESSEIETLLERVVRRRYIVESRMTIDVEVRNEPGGVTVWSSFAINEVSLEKRARERMIDVLVAVDGRPLSRWGTDGVLVATPTGSTAYAFSALGPVMWPDLAAILLVPMSAHALFARPMVLSPRSSVTMTVVDSDVNKGVVWCDGRRSVDIEPGMEIEVRSGMRELKLARLNRQPFVDRLVRKFALPVEGWRGNAN